MDRRIWMACAAWLVAVPGLIAADARAWGGDGHAIVALVAEHHLEPGVRTKVQAMLAKDRSGLTGRDIAAQAEWADRYRDSDRDGTRERYEQTRRWHFVNLELARPRLAAACPDQAGLPRGTPAAAGPANACIVDKIVQFREELAAPATSATERLRALQFLLHLMGDVHQPLHAASDHDAGGNDKQVRAAGRAAGSLHHYWDTEFVRALGKTPQAAAERLIARTTPRQIGEWSAGDPARWAMQSFRAARTHAYGKLPAPGTDGVRELPPEYVANANRVVAQQLARAGVRLAMVLNEALR